METLIAEDVLLLLLDDEKGTLAHADKIQPLLGGALLIELALAERIEVADRTSRWSTPKVAVVGCPRPDDPLLVDAIAIIEEKPRGPQSLVTRLGKGTKEVLLHRLVERGLVHAARGKVLGLFPRTTWPAADRGHEHALLGRLEGPLVRGLRADERTSALISLLAAIDHAHHVVERGDVPAKEVKRRAQEIADGDWAAAAVKDAVVAAQRAMTAAIVATTAAAAAGGS
ncbi:GOLPH3/VPS74 family protein [Nocardioides sp.]|uniref:GOLPH3/VPS74 family protein n=1 Tax=Nocardioides sp. TaxID=35761 RepID=UPI002BA06CCA|nr:GPP34 family phosphoprotein [Nocardioides sp.]HXH79874.1 GPP34 family phosphoprotein [Nocardioides sp.]